MASPYDPYAPPSAPLDDPRPPGPAPVEIPAAVIHLLAQTRPWVKLLSVAFFALFGLLALVLMVAVGRGAFDGPPGRGASFLQFLPLVIVMLVYIPPALFLWQYAGGIRRLQEGGGLRALEGALHSQKSFWKYSGVLMVVVLGLYAAILVGGAVVKKLALG